MSRTSQHPVSFSSPHSNPWPSLYDQSPQVQDFQSVVSGHLQAYSVRILVPLVPVTTIPIDGSCHTIDRLRYSTISLLLFSVLSGSQFQYSVRILVPLAPAAIIPVDGPCHTIDHLRYSSISLSFPVFSLHRRAEYSVGRIIVPLIGVRVYLILGYTCPSVISYILLDLALHHIQRLDLNADESNHQDLPSRMAHFARDYSRFRGVYPPSSSGQLSLCICLFLYV
jgi:hypothetical protein